MRINLSRTWRAISVRPSATVAAPPPAAAVQPWINEVHYDNKGRDASEFLEVALPASGPPPADVSVTLYNGANGTPYWVGSMFRALNVPRINVVH